MKKFLAIVLTLLMCMALFAGCGNDTNEDAAKHQSWGM